MQGTNMHSNAEVEATVDDRYSIVQPTLLSVVYHDNIYIVRLRILRKILCKVEKRWCRIIQYYYPESSCSYSLCLLPLKIQNYSEHEIILLYK